MPAARIHIKIKGETYEVYEEGEPWVAERMGPFDMGTHYAHRVCIRKDGHEACTDYHTSVAEYLSGKKYMTEEDLLLAFQAILEDLCLSLQDFEDLVAELGLEHDAVKAHKVYEALGEMAEKFFGEGILPRDERALIDLMVELKCARGGKEVW